MVERLAIPLAVYARLVLAHVRSQLQYRTSFALNAIGAFLVTFLDFAAVLVIFHNVPALGGWSVGEVALLYGISWSGFAVAEMVMGHLDRLPELVRSGDFDMLLLRPRGTLLQVIASDFQLRRIGHLVQAAAILAFAIVTVDVQWDMVRVSLLAVTVASSAVIFASVWAAAICIVFFTVEGREVANAFTYGGQFFSNFPAGIYERWLRRLLGYGAAMAFIAWIPAIYILDKPRPDGMPTWLSFVSPLVAVLAMLVAGRIWRMSVRAYRSAGG